MTSERASPQRLVLASGSPHRRKLLAAAGVPFEVCPAHVDEAKIKRALVAEHAGAEQIAASLARIKAETVSAELSGALVIGADQTLSCEGRLFDKPGSLAGACEQLRHLRGKTHHLHSAVALVQDGRAVRQFVETAALTMRAFSDDFLESYIARCGDALLGTVGAYQIESFGIQLLEAVQGDTSTIVGLPMLPLLAELRARGIIQS